MLLTRSLCSSNSPPLPSSPFVRAKHSKSRTASKSSPVLSCQELSSLSTPQLDRCIDSILATHLAADVWPSSAYFAEVSKRTPPAYLRASERSIAAISTLYAETCALCWRSHFESNASSALAKSVQQLQITWAWSRYYFPNDSFFAGAVSTSDLSAKWRSPHIQAALCEATAQLLSLPAHASIGRHFSSWGYLCGCVMYQLLQWNHQLTPETLRELFS